MKRTHFIVERAGAAIHGSGGLRCAARRGYLSVVIYLFLESHDIEDASPGNSNNLQGKDSALTEAARNGRTLVIRYLLENGADSTFRSTMHDGPSGTALELADQAGHIEAVGILRDWNQNA